VLGAIKTDTATERRFGKDKGVDEGDCNSCVVQSESMGKGDS
jgi:hypothetical protein